MLHPFRTRRSAFQKFSTYWSVGGCFGVKRPAWMLKTGGRDAFLEQSRRCDCVFLYCPFERNGLSLAEKRHVACRETAFRSDYPSIALPLPFHCPILSLSYLPRPWFGPHSALQALWPNELRMSSEWAPKEVVDSCLFSRLGDCGSEPAMRG